MFKKTLLSLAVASTLGLTGCFDSSDDNKNANSSPQNTPTAVDGKTWPIFNPATKQLPVPNDLLFSGTVDGTFKMGSEDNPVTEKSDPITKALDSLSGASTVAPLVIETNGQLDPETVKIGTTVHLIELAYASGNPLQALSISEPPTLEIAVTGPSAAPEVRADVETVGGTSAIRIVPLKPLNPNKRYVVAITNGVKDVNGDPIIQDPMYSNITATGTEEDPAAGLVNGALADIRTLVNNLWEPIALKYVEAIGGELSEDDIALAYSFTTSNDEKVLQYIAEPAAWLQDQLTASIATKAASEAIKKGAKDYDTVKLAVDKAIEGFPSKDFEPTPEIAAVLGLCQQLNQETIPCASAVIASDLENLLPTPTAEKRAADKFDLTQPPQSVRLISALANKVYESIDDYLQAVSEGAISAPEVLAVQGTISLPYYLGTTKDTIESKSWEADSTIARKLNEKFDALDLELPQGLEDEEGKPASTTVNSIFPFPEKVNDVDAPLLVIYPETGIKGVVQFQHGITTDRSTALTFGTALAALGYAVVAIDQPLHGVNDFTPKDQDELAGDLLKAANKSNPKIVNNAATREALLNGTFKVGVLMSINAELIKAGQSSLFADPMAPTPAEIGSAIPFILDGNAGPDAENSLISAIALENTVSNAGSTIPGLAADLGNERHFELSESGGKFINLTSFTTTRDNLRQSVLDQMNLRAGLSNLNLKDSDGNNLPLKELPVFVVGHSLGSITGTVFTASVNANQGINIPAIPDVTVGTNPEFNDIKAVSLLTPGAGVVRMLENSPAFAPTIIAGLKAGKLNQNASDYTKFLNVLQGAIDSADPINFADTLNAKGTASYHAVVQGDLVIPNAADENAWGIKPLKGTLEAEINDQSVQVTIDSFPAPLAGSYPLVGLLQDLDSTGIESSPYFFALSDYLEDGTVPVDEDGLPVLSHSTPVSAQPTNAFAEMVLGTKEVFDGAITAE